MTITNRHFAAELFGSVTAVLLATSLSGCAAVADTPLDMEAASGGTAGDEYSSGAAAKALARLQGIPVKGRAPKTGYSRDEFGPAWSDTDHNGCDTRNDILARDLTGETFKPGTDNYVVATGTLADKYTGTTISFVRGHNTSAAVQIDHIVALGDAWQKGGQQLSTNQREELANDPLNLMAVGGHTNSAKGDKDAAAWLPPNTAFHCDYVSKQVVIKAKFSLWVTQAEHEALLDILEGCKCTAMGSGVRPQFGRGPTASVFWDSDTPFSLLTIVGAREDH